MTGIVLALLTGILVRTMRGEDNPTIVIDKIVDRFRAPDININLEDTPWKNKINSATTRKPI